MRRLVWASSFRRALRRYLKRHPGDRERVAEALGLLSEDPFTPQLETHRLKGTLQGLWACTAAYDCRIVFEFARDGDEEVILLVDVGTHDEVY